MRSASKTFRHALWGACAGVSMWLPAICTPAELFDTPEQAAHAMIDAAEKFDVAALINLVGSESEDILFSGEVARDRQRAKEFATQARQKSDVEIGRAHV